MGCKILMKFWMSFFVNAQLSSVTLSHCHVNGELSETHQNPLGVPHGSILGPLLFNIYINSFPTAVEKSGMILCAGDAVLSLFCDNTTRVKEDFATWLYPYSDWYTYNRLTLNVKKTKIVCVGRKPILSKFEDFDFSLEAGKLIVFLLLNTSALPWTKNGIGNYRSSLFKHISRLSKLAERMEDSTVWFY